MPGRGQGRGQGLEDAASKGVQYHPCTCTSGQEVPPQKNGCGQGI